MPFISCNGYFLDALASLESTQVSQSVIVSARSPNPLNPSDDDDDGDDT